MSQQLPSFLEDHISQIPALQLLQNLGWRYLTPEESVAFRGGKLGNVLLESVLVEQLRFFDVARYDPSQSKVPGRFQQPRSPLLLSW